jgi:hypothetical protein
MPVTRAQLPSVAGFDRHLYIGEAIERASGRLMRWVLGTGFLALDLALFATSLLIAYTWALIAHPDDFTSIGPFRYWGIVALIHIVLTGGGLLAWKLLGLDQPRARTAIPPYSTPSQPRPGVSAWSSVPAGEAPVSARGSTGRGSSSRQPAWSIRPVEQNWPQQPDLLRSRPGEIDPDLGEVTWPENAPLSTSLGVSAAPGSDQLTTEDRPSPSQTWFDSFMGSRSAGRKSGDKDQRWSWVEAAAGSWLSRRETPGPADASVETGEDIVISPPVDTDHPQA